MLPNLHFNKLQQVSFLLNIKCGCIKQGHYSNKLGATKYTYELNHKEYDEYIECTSNSEQ